MFAWRGASSRNFRDLISSAMLSEGSYRNSLYLRRRLVAIEASQSALAADWRCIDAQVSNLLTYRSTCMFFGALARGRRTRTAEIDDDNIWGALTAGTFPRINDTRSNVTQAFETVGNVHRFGEEHRTVCGFRNAVQMRRSFNWRTAAYNAYVHIAYTGGKTVKFVHVRWERPNINWAIIEMTARMYETLPQEATKPCSNPPSRNRDPLVCACKKYRMNIQVVQLITTRNWRKNNSFEA